MKARIANNKNIQTMEQKDIDIYEILKDEEYGTELYTPKCGNVWHSGMANDKDSAKAIWTEDGAGREHFFDKNGKIYKEGEVLLFPSKEMRDWSKHYRNYGTKNRVADRAMRERKKPDVEKALSMFKNPQQAAHLAWLLENKKE